MPSAPGPSPARSGSARPAALITGATGGIGRALVGALADHRQVLLGRDAAVLAGLAEELPEASWVAADLSQPEDLELILGVGAALPRRLDLRIHAAGAVRVAPLEHQHPEAWAEALAVNLAGPAELTRLCNAYGLDTIEAGCTLAVAMEGGLASFGDGKKAIELLHEMGKGTPVGRILGAGTETAARVLGVRRVPTVKGQSMPAYEPRAIKGIGMTYAIATMGADHTSGYTIAPEILGVSGKVDQFDVDKAALVRNFQYATGWIDSTGHCLFIAFAILDIASGFEGAVEECNGVLGTNWTMDDVGRIGKQVLDTELDFNRRAGFTKLDDRMPEFMRLEQLPPHNVTWDVPDSTLDAVFG